MALAASRFTATNPYPYLRERELLFRWARHCEAELSHDACDSCGLSTAWSPPNTIDRIYVMGERSEDDVDGYPPEPAPVPDPELDEVSAFIEALHRSHLPTYEALLARHRKLVRGRLMREKTEWQVATALYQQRNSWPLLVKACETGYTMMRVRLFIWRQRTANIA